MAQRTATFTHAMGGVQADLLFVEWSDRDAGSGLRPWWDDTNHVLPHVSRAVLWESALSAAAGKRLILWQVPVGNMSLNDTCDHYRDNRAAYAFSHPRDLFDAGVIAVLFGGGATCMTRPSTDGGFVQAQGSIAYASPVTPMHLIAGPLIGDARLPLQWDENTEPNLWGYRVSYARSGSGVSYTLDVGPANSTSLLLPSAGKWQVRVQAYDAMGQPGPLGNSVVVTTSLDLPQVFLPVVER